MEGLHDSNWAGPFANIVRLMAIAEEEMAAVDADSRLFGVLLPPPALRSLAPELYRAHCRELLAREDGHDLGTAAEVLAALSATSLASPLNPLGCALYDRLFAECMPDVNLEPTGHAEPYPGALDERLAECRRKLSDPNRRLK